MSPMRCFPNLAWALLILPLLMSLSLADKARAHDFPFSYLEMRFVEQGTRGLETVLEAPAIDFAHDLGDITPEQLLAPANRKRRQNDLFALVQPRLQIEVAGQTLTPQRHECEPGKDPADIRLRLFYPWNSTPASLTVTCRLFPYDPRHKTFLTLYRGDKVQQQAIFDANTETVTLAGQQSTWEIVRRFVAEGIHHIFIGPDHILFIVGLVLLPARLSQLLKIVTAFTLAHSITLALATFDLLDPPARLIEPTIALSIVFVGVNALLQESTQQRVPDTQAEATPQLAPLKTASPDLRLWFAFGFGLIHGFGFAGVLKELELPQMALGWSLGAFNMGVEIGQACIVLAVAPLLGMLHRHVPRLARSLVALGALVVITAGSYWFVERAFLQGGAG